MMLTTKKVGIATAASFFVLIGSSCGPTNFSVREMKIDSNLHLIPVGHRTILNPREGSYYSFFHAATGLTIVDHFNTRPGTGLPESLFYLEAGRNHVLDRTVKTEQLLKGAYGTVYSEKTCFYASPLSRGYSSVSVGGANYGLGEIPDVLPKAPEAVPPLTSMSVVRIFHESPEYVIVAGNYEPDGKMGSLQVSAAKNGHRVPLFDDGDYLYPGVTPQPVRFAQKYGIPETLDIQKYQRSGRLSLPSVALQQEIAVVDLHYGYDKLIRQDTLDNGVIASSRFLRPSVTPEEAILDPICESRFHQQLSMGLSTVFSHHLLRLPRTRF